MPTLDGNRYRCRVRNAFGQKFSNSARLTVSAGYTWTPLPNQPLIGSPLTDTDVYAASYLDNYTAPGSISSTLIGAALQTYAVANNNSFPPGDAVLFCGNCISLFFNSAGSKSFDLSISLLAGAYFGSPPLASTLRLYSLDGLTLYDTAADGGGMGNLSVTLSLNVPAAGQYLIFTHFERQTVTPGSELQFGLGYTLGAGDAVALVIP